MAGAIEFKYTHIWHEPDWWLEFDRKTPNRNSKFVNDNLKNKCANLKNTAWKVVKDEEGRLVVQCK